MFIWLLRHDGLLTNKKKQIMNLGSGMCKRCGDVEEDALHVLWDFPTVVGLWLAAVCTNKHAIFCW